MSQNAQATQLDNPMESEEGTKQATSETDKLRLEMNVKFERWKNSAQEERNTQAPRISQLETKLKKMK